jgi:lactoylglutathione lyase
MKISYAMAFVSDMSISTAFYKDTLGLTLRFTSPHWTEFDCGGARFALHSADHDSLGEEWMNRAGQCRPGFTNEDLGQFHERMLAANVTCLQPPKDTFGVLVAQYLDPDGLVISVSQAKEE